MRYGVYISAWLAKRGARPIGIDNSKEQLRNAKRFREKNNLFFPIVHRNAEVLPFADGTFDMAITEYGASIWCDPYKWIPEAARVLWQGGELRFLMNSALMMLCAPDEGDVAATNALLRPYFGMHHFEWPDDDSVEFHLTHGDWIRLLRKNGFEILDLLELRPSEKASTKYPFVTLDWAQRWPSEEVWLARKT